MLYIYPHYLLRVEYERQKLSIKLHAAQDESLQLYETTIKKKFIETGISTQLLYQSFKYPSFYEVSEDNKNIIVKIPQNQLQTQQYSLVLKESENSSLQVDSSALKTVTHRISTQISEEVKLRDECKNEIMKKIQASKSIKVGQHFKLKRLNTVARRFNLLIDQINKLKKDTLLIDTELQELNYMEIEDEGDDESTQYEIRRTRNRKFDTSQIQMPLQFGSRFVEKFAVGKNLIKYNSEEQEFTQILMSKPIPYSLKYEFHIKVINSKNGKIMIGIVNRNRIEKRRSYDSGMAVCYYGFNGWICESEYSNTYRSQGYGFKDGDTVTVVTELDRGLIQWRVNGSTEARTLCEFVKNRNIPFVPYLEMYEKGDICKWISDWTNDRTHRLSFI